MTEAPISRTPTDDRTGAYSLTWHRTYLLLYAGVEALLLLLPPVLDDSFLAFTGWLALIIGVDLGLTVWAGRLPVKQVGITRRLRLVNITSALLWGMASLCGLWWFDRTPAWWIPAALIVMLPAVCVYWRPDTTT